MYGNAWEWVTDWIGPYHEEPQVDPWGPPGGAQRVQRGGSCEDAADIVRVAFRGSTGPQSWYSRRGFRVVLAATSGSPEPGKK